MMKGRRTIRTFVLVGVLSIFSVLSLPSLAQVGFGTSVAPPVISVYPKTISNTEVFYVGGSAAPLTTVFLFFEHSGREIATAQSQVGTTGEWFYVHERVFPEGSYTLTTRAQNDEGVVSPASASIRFDVLSQAIQIGGLRLRYETLYLVITLTLLLLLVGLSASMLGVMMRIRGKNLRLKKEVWEAEAAIRQGFRVLRDDIAKEVESLTDLERRRPLSSQEHERRAQLQKDLEFVAENVEKEVGDIERQL